MGLLIDVEHPERLRDPAHGARLLRALDVERVHVSGLEPASHAEIDRVLAAVGDERESQVSYEGGVLDPAALDVVEALADAVEGYLDLNTRTASLRVWPTHAWMHGYARISDADVSAVLGRTVTIPDGTTTIDDVTFELPGCNGHVPFDVRTPRADIAARLFRVLSDGKLTRGHCGPICGRMREPLRFFLRLVRAKLEAQLVADLDTAVALAAEIPFEELTWDSHTPDVRILFPERKVMTYILAPTNVNGEAAWRAQITDAFARAG